MMKISNASYEVILNRFTTAVRVFGWIKKCPGPPGTDENRYLGLSFMQRWDQKCADMEYYTKKDNEIRLLADRRMKLHSEALEKMDILRTRSEAFQKKLFCSDAKYIVQKTILDQEKGLQQPSLEHRFRELMLLHSHMLDNAQIGELMDIVRQFEETRDLNKKVIKMFELEITLRNTPVRYPPRVCDTSEGKSGKK